MLVFHSVLEQGERGNRAVISTAELERTFQAMREKDYHPISLRQMHAFLEGRGSVPQRAVLLTFDDGYRDLAINVLPLTQKYHYPAVAFPVMKWFQPYRRPDQDRDPELPFRPHLSTAEWTLLLGSGLWDAGGHSYDGHWRIPAAGGKEGPFLTTRQWLVDLGREETTGEYRARVWQDILLTRQALQEAGREPPFSFAYPYGARSVELERLLQEAGFRYLYTLEPGLNRAGQDPARIRRFSAGVTAEENLSILEKAFTEAASP